MITVRRAVLSVHDKTGLVELARFLAERGVELISTGGTERVLRDAGVPVIPVSAVTGQPEMLDGRVKTLHPKLLGGVLALRDRESHRAALASHGIGEVDLVVVNLYPFEATVARPGSTAEEAIENIDIGGPTLIRAAAKNHPHVAVVVEPEEYGALIAELRATGGIGVETARRWAGRAFAATAAYDAAIGAWFHRDVPFPDRVCLRLDKVANLRYGENPHQRAALYRDPAWSGPSLADARVLAGKEMSFNNYGDAEAALGLVREFGDPAAVVVKHGNPCGAACGSDLLEAYDAAVAGDPLSAFGGVLAFNECVSVALAERIGERFFEVVVAPSWEDGAVAALGRRKNLRLLAVDDRGGPWTGGMDWKRLRGGALLADWDQGAEEERRVVTARPPDEAERRALELAWTVCKHLRSNAIALARDGALVGAGAGQMSRVDAVDLAVRKAGDRSRGAALASDAFFPFADGLERAARAGVTAVIQPGGSVKDAEVIGAAEKAGVAMVFTGTRHFRH